MGKKTELAIDLGQTIYANTIRGLEAENARLREELAAAQATIEQMGEALENHSGNYKLSKSECEKINAILAIPTNLDAMHEDRARECERLMKIAHKKLDTATAFWLYVEAADHRAKKEEGK